MLNDEQLAAVEHAFGHPAAVISGAGSGKTTVLTARVKWLMDQGIEPKRILACTFTNRAAEELMERLQIDSEAPVGSVPRVTTIHSLALAAIRRNPKGFGLQEKVTLLDDYDASQMVKKLIEKKGLENMNPYAVLEHINFHRSRGIGYPVDYTETVHKKAQGQYSGYHALGTELLNLWKDFEFQKNTSSTIDFNDMLACVTRRIREDKPWAAAFAKMFAHVLVDECQDTSIVQWELLNGLLAEDNPNMYTVGDASQSIYSFTGASPELLMDYTRGWRSMVPTMYKLQRNHRSVPQIVNLANSIQRKMTDVVPVQMDSFRGDSLGHKGTTKLLRASTPEDIALSIANDIYRDNASGEILYKENFIIVRTSGQIKDVENALVKKRIPYIIRGGKGLMQTEEVRDVLAYLRVAANPKDYMAYIRSISVPKRGVGDKGLEKIREVANKDHSGNLIEASYAVNSTRLGTYVRHLKEIQANIANPVKALDTVLRTINYKEYLKEKYKKDEPKLEMKQINLERLSEVIGALYEESGLSTEDIVFQLSMNDQTKDDSKDPKGKVVIATIHSTKGLENKRVFVTGVVETLLPHKFSMTNENEIAEERRILYVACTRPRDILVICVPENLISYKGVAYPVLPSRFLTELKII